MTKKWHRNDKEWQKNDKKMTKKWQHKSKMTNWQNNYFGISNVCRPKIFLTLLIHINYPNVLLLKSSPAMPPWSFQGRPWVNFCAAIGACPGRSLSALPRPGFDHGYTICCTIWGFPKIGGTKIWMVYKGKLLLKWMILGCPHLWN